MKYFVAIVDLFPNNKEPKAHPKCGRYKGWLTEDKRTFIDRNGAKWTDYNPVRVSDTTVDDTLSWYESAEKCGFPVIHKRFDQIDDYSRKDNNAHVFQMIENQIRETWEDRFITNPSDGEFIESLIRLTESKLVLEVGVCTGFATLHMIRGVYPNGMVYGIEPRPAFDVDFFSKPEIACCWRHVNGWAPDVLKELNGLVFDLVFIDSQHDIEHTRTEIEALMPYTRSGTVFLFHDCPKRDNPTAKEDGVIYKLLTEYIKSGRFTGSILQNARRLDCEDVFGKNHSKQLLPHLGMLVRV